MTARTPETPGTPGTTGTVEPAVLTPDVVIVGAGPAGLTAAAELAPRLDGQVLVLDREREAGGIPRHSDHTGYGLRDLRRVMTGPAYARRLADAAVIAGAAVRTGATVTGWAGDRSLEVTSPQGRLRVDARAVVLATGARERPRPARKIPGDRPAGVYTTGHLQNLVHLHHGAPGTRAVVVGAELVSWSAVLTLREAGCRTVLMTTELPSPESYAAFNLPGRALLGVPVATRTRLTRIIGSGGTGSDGSGSGAGSGVGGHKRLEAVEIEDLATGRRRTVECDTLVLTGDWIPDHELARSAGLEIDPGTRGPLVDTALRTSRPGVFAAGNVLHPVDTADIAALDGRHVAGEVLAFLAGREPSPDGVRFVADAPFRWVAPGLLRPGDPAPARGRLLLWTDELVRVPRVVLRQDGRVLARRTVPWPASPGRVFRVPWSMVRSVDPHGGPVHVGLR
ncbi:NAD(P)/FAD-dependent oxidoreductase [Actinomadura xylanilytica]|uniref:NAD(P)/FAD-dependent oxidoreductase n=1 Tax=Actinomadura xylanilytica TaxID=887459 RepID=UPI00255B03EB|nr:FAD-dependent oxidoreductase [Actinomadura xylanilytica]MDL4772578.1 FAD-dependent oxidoreductase [Actinomadura xylanilytica]